MSRDLHGDLLTATLSDVVYPALLVEIGYGSGAEHAWTGVGDLVWNSQTFLGVGELGSVSPVSETTDQRADGVTFRLSGIPSARVAAVLSDSRYGLPAKMWFTCFTAAGVMIGDPYLVFSGLTDAPTIEDGADTATITIQAESRMVSQETSLNRRFTPEDQKIDYPTDKGFDFVASLQDKQITFGKS